MTKGKTSTPKGKKTGTARGTYAPRQPAAPPSNPLLDAIVAREAYLIPALKVRSPKTEGEQVAIEVGTTSAQDGSMPVYMHPFIYRDGHRLRFQWYDENEKTKPIEHPSIKFYDDIMSFTKTFDNQKVKGKWTNKQRRLHEWRQWVMFIWETRTLAILPTTKATGSKKRSAPTKIEQDGGKDSLANLANKKLRAPMKLAKANDSPLDRPMKDHHDVWVAYNEGTFEIDNELAIRNVHRAHRALFRGDVHPNLRQLREAYDERLARRLSACTLTETWLVWQTRAVGSPAEVYVDFTDYAALASGPLNRERIEAALRSGQFGQSDGLRNRSARTLPDIEEAINFVQDWVDRGRDPKEIGMELRMAKLVIEMEEARTYERLFGQLIWEVET